MKYFICILISLTTISLPAMNRRKIPYQAEEYIEQSYPHAKKVEWHKLNAEKLIEAEFKSEGKDIIILFKPDGTWQQVQEEISPDKIPEAIKDKMQSNLLPESVVEVTNNGEEPFYMISGTKSKKYSFEIYSTQDGQDFHSNQYRTQTYTGVFIGMVLIMIVLFP